MSWGIHRKNMILIRVEEKKEQREALSYFEVINDTMTWRWPGNTRGHHSKNVI